MSDAELLAKLKDMYEVFGYISVMTNAPQEVGPEFSVM